MNQAQDQGGIFERSIGERPSDRAIEKSSEQASTHTRLHCLCFIRRTLVVIRYGKFGMEFQLVLGGEGVAKQ